jgi:hypothetical protein
MFRGLGFLFNRLARDADAEAINHPYAKATTPDEIIAAAIMQSFAKDFASWEWKNVKYGTCMADVKKILEGGEGSTYHTSDAREIVENFKLTKLVNSALDISLTPIMDKSARGNYHYVRITGVTVSGYELTKEIQQRIWTTWKDVSSKVRAAEAAAAAAKKAMEENERKWNLAERLLNMKRNEQGVLVPVVEAI